MGFNYKLMVKASWYIVYSKILFIYYVVDPIVLESRLDIGDEYTTISQAPIWQINARLWHCSN